MFLIFFLIALKGKSYTEVPEYSITDALIICGYRRRVLGLMWF